jgi:hypothetical protein
VARHDSVPGIWFRLEVILAAFVFTYPTRSNLGSDCSISLLAASFATEWFGIVQSARFVGRESRTQYQTQTTFGIQGRIVQDAEAVLTFYEVMMQYSEI